MGQLKQEYRALMERLDHHAVSLPRPEDERALEGWRELLEVMYTPEEAALASRMPMMPTSLARLAGRLDMPEQELREKLEPLCDKGLVCDLVNPRTGETKYLLAPPVVGFFEFSMMRAHDMFDKLAVAKAMDAYMHGDDTFAREVFGNDTVVGRAMVHEDVLAADIPEVLDWERTTSLLRDADQLAVFLSTIVALAGWTILGTATVLAFTLYELGSMLPFLSELNTSGKVAISAMLGIVLSAQSPAVVMALLNETRAEGNLSRTILGTAGLAPRAVDMDANRYPGQGTLVHKALHDAVSDQ
jgi:hypothetical protein